MPGLLDFANTDDGMQALGLLGAAAPSMAPQNFAGRLAQAAKGYQGMKDDMLKQQDAAQQLQIKNIALQQQQQEWAMQYPLLQKMAAQLSGTPQTQPDAQPAAQPAPQPATMSYSGTPRDMLSGDPVQQSQSMPPSAQQPMQAPQRGSMFPNVADNVALPIAAFGGMKSLLPVITKYNEPTELAKQLVAAGIDPNSPQGRQTMMDAINKANYIAPTRLGEGAYNDPKLGVVGLPSAAQPGYINQKQPDGSWATQQIGNGLAAVTDSGAARARGPAQLTPQKVYNPRTKQFEYQTQASVADAASGIAAPSAAIVPTQGASTAPPGKLRESGIRQFADASSIAPEIPLPGYLAQLDAELKKPMSTAQRQPLMQERADVAAKLNQAPQAQQPAPSGAFAAEPSLGATANADTANKVSSESMNQSYAKLRAAASAAPSITESIAEMKALASKKVPFVQSGMIGGLTQAVSTDAAKYEKLRANLTANLAATFGTNDSDKGRDLAGQMVPDYTKPVSAQQFGLDSLDRQVQTQALKSQVLSPYVQKSDAVGYAAVESAFDKAISPSLIPKLKPVLEMPASKSRGMLLQNLMQDPAMKKALNFAAENGLLK